MQLKVSKIHPRAILPSYKYLGDSGLSLHSMYDYIVQQNEVTQVLTGIRVEIPFNYEGQIRARSGLSQKYGITIAQGVGTIDSGYRGELIVLLTKFTPGVYNIQKGDAIAQLVIAPITIVSVHEVEELSNLTTRNTGGFGSTGRT